MSKFLIDENLPAKVSVWKGDDFEFVTSAFQSENDSAIWDHAKANGLTIVTKDSDFSMRIMSSSPPPKVIHIKIGNLRLRELCSFLESNWKMIESTSSHSKLVNVFRDRIEAVD
jgi:predicted nuclease of predicted toxin-antitoxin system